ncbi:MAG: hypothetical protein K6U08_03230 [Firmicutes bacterium]|nr:hypothetical protein [Bacillota bacterium]
MVLDLLFTGLAWAALAAVFRFALHLPWILATPSALGALLAYDWLLNRREDARSSAEEREDPVPANINILATLFRGLIYLAGGVFLLFWLVTADMYLEAGGAKLAFPDFEWPREVRALLVLVGLPPDVLKFSTVMGLIVTVANIALAMAIVYYAFAFYSNLARLRSIIGRWREEQSLREILNLVFPLVVVVCLTVVFIGFFTRYSYPLAQLLLAHRLWPAEFEPQVTFGEAIAPLVDSGTADLNEVLGRHRGEFSAFLVRSVPVGLLLAHLLAAMLVEFGTLLMHTAGRQIEQRQAHVIRLARQVLAQALAERREGRRQSLPQFEMVPVAAAGPPAVLPRTPPHDPGAGGRPGRGQGPTTAPVVSDEELLDLPVLAAGTSESITPREALAHPDLYDVRLEIDSETGERYYRVRARMEDAA